MSEPAGGAAAGRSAAGAPPGDRDRISTAGGGSAADAPRGPSARGPSTRAVHAGLPPAVQGEPFLPGPVFAAPYHLAGPADASPLGYGRDANPTWLALEAALGELEGGTAVSFASGMAAAAAILLELVEPGDAVVVPSDGYPGVRRIAAEHLRPRGVDIRLVGTDEAAVRAATAGAALVWIETPSNPALDVLDVPALADAAHEAGALLVVDATLATPLRLRPLELGADFSMASASKYLSGHSDLVLGYVAARDENHAERLRSWRTLTGPIPGPFEAWLAHRSLATLAVRLERQEANARALAELLASMPGVTGVRWPGVGAVVAFELGSEQRAQAFLAACELVAEATSFGGLHTSGERRARWGTDAVGEGFIRLNAGIEDAADLLDDVRRALAAAG
jgi:cystathionine gamma-lyase